MYNNYFTSSEKKSDEDKVDGEEDEDGDYLFYIAPEFNY